MRKIFHLRVNNASDKELSVLVDRFRKEGVFVNSSDVYVSSFDIPDGVNAQQYQLIISAGSSTWKPQQSELDSLKTLFQAACVDPAGGVVATRHGVTVQVHLIADENNPSKLIC